MDSSCLSCCVCDAMALSPWVRWGSGVCALLWHYPRESDGWVVCGVAMALSPWVRWMGGVCALLWHYPRGSGGGVVCARCYGIIPVGQVDEWCVRVAMALSPWVRWMSGVARCYGIIPVGQGWRSWNAMDETERKGYKYRAEG